MDLLGDRFDDANHNVLEALSLRVVVKYEVVSFLRVCAAEWGGSHPGIDGTQVVMQGIQILKV